MLLLDLGEREGAREHVVAVAMHHIVSDGWSTDIFIGEFVRLYEAFSAGRASPLEELPLQYADYALWQRGFMQGEVLERQLAYWRGRLADAPPVLELPTDRARPAVQDHAGATHRFEVDKTVAEALRRLGRRENATLFMTLLAAFQLLLSRYSGQSDICVGAPIANRRRVELEGLIGFFVNTLVLRVDASGNPSFLDLLGRVREAALGAQAHQDLPFERLVEELQPQRDMSVSPLFQVMFVLQNSSAQDSTATRGLCAQPYEMKHRSAKFDLSMVIEERGESLSATLEYATALFDAATIAGLAQHFCILLEGIAANPHSRLSELPLLGAAERHRLLIEWNATASAYAQDACLHTLFEAQAGLRPAATAATFENQRLSYGELNARANRLAHALRRRGVGPEVVVGLCVERSLEMIVGLLGVLKAGGAYLPLDPGYPGERLAFMIADAAPALILTQEALRGRLPDHVATLCLDAEWAAVAAESDGDPCAETRAQNLAYVIYTSGSTGKPKGVGVSHRNVTRLFGATEIVYGFVAQDVWTLYHSFAFDFSVWEIWGALLYGGRLVIVPYLVSRSPEAFRELLVREKVTVLNQTPSSFYQLNTTDAAQEAAQPLSLRLVIFGGEALERRRLASWFDRHVSGGPELVNMYGITETTVHVTLERLSKDNARDSIGRPLSHLQIYLLDPHMTPVPVGVAGELHIGGAGLARGYLKRPDLTAARFVPNPFGGAGERLYRTGDLARYRADGNIEFLGRVDHQVKIRGFRIELGEIEAALSRLPQVREALVLAREDVPGEKRLVAYVTGDEGAQPDAAALRAGVSRELPDYMVPSAFVVLEALPLTPSGKIDRRALPAPDGAAQLARRYVAPRNAAEEALCRIFAEVLRLERVGVEDNFFELGGDSLLCVKAVGIARNHGLKLTLASVYRMATIRSIVAELDESAICTASPTPAQPFALITDEDRLRLTEDIENAYPLTQLQLGMIYHSSSGDDSYHIIDSMTLRCPFALEALTLAFSDITASQPALRTSFDLATFHEPLQLIHREPAVVFECFDVRGASEEERDRSQQRFLALQAAQHFDLAKAPLARFYVHQLTNETLQFTFVHHHAILDGWSVNMLLVDVINRYFEYLRGTALPISPDRSWAMQQLVGLEREALLSQETEQFWSHKIGKGATIQLTQSKRSGVNSKPPTAKTVVSQEVRLSHELSQKMHALAASLGLPVKSVALAAHLKVLRLLFGEFDITTGVVCGVRPENPASDRAQGLFLNTLPLRLRMAGGAWRDLIIASFEAERELLKHRFYPLAALQRKHGSEPIFNAVFNYLHYHIVNDMREPNVELLASSNKEAALFGLLVTFWQDPATSDFVVLVVADHETAETYLANDITEHFVRTLAAMVADVDARYELAPLLGEAERHRLLIEWNATASAYAQDACLHTLFEAQAGLRPAATAATFENQRLSYGALNARANRLAHALRRRGVGPEVVVGLCVERSLEMIVGLLGVLKAGGAYLPLDPGYPEERLGFMIADAAPALILTQEALRGRLPDHVATLCLDAEWAAVAGESDGDPCAETRAQNLAYVIYTSGSTGKPKGVASTHGGIPSLAAAQRARFGVNEQSRVLQFAALGFDAALSELAMTLSCGACLVLPREDERSGERLIGLLRRERITHATLPPAVLPTLAATPELALECLIVAGEACPIEATKRWAVGRRMINAYGPTEATVCATMSEALVAGEAAPIGRPISNTQIYVLDDRMTPVPVGVAGELHIGGAGLARGYLKRPDLTAARFVPNPFGGAGERLYRTGDLARYRADGNIEFLGRVDHQVKIRGFRIELGEIEAALSRLPQVREALVLAREDVPGEKRLVAYVTGDEGARPDAAALRAGVSRELPDYMVPSAFVVLEALPLTPNGKVDRKALPAPDGAAQLARRYVAPRNAAEEALCRIFAEVLRLERVGVEDNFFELGGHSLFAVTLVERLRREGFASDVRALFSHPTPGALAGVVGGGAAVEAPPNLIPADCAAITPQMLTLAQLSQADVDRIVAQVPGGAANVQDIYPLAPLQEGILFHHLMAEKGDPYLFQTLLAFDSRERFNAFFGAFQAAIERHDILRTAVVWEGLPEPMQVVWRKAPLVVEELDLSGETEDIGEVLLQRFDPRKVRFDLQQAPMMRAFAAYDAINRRWLSLLLTHHLTWDHTTLEIVVEEAQADLLGQSRPDSEPMPFRNFVAQARDGVSVAEHEAFFQAMLADVSETTAPFGFLEALCDGSRIAQSSLVLDIELSRRLRARSRLLGMSPATLFHFAFALVLAQVSGRMDVVFGTVLFGRMHGGKGADRGVGLYINTLPIRLRLGEADVIDGVRRMHQILIELMQHEHASLALAQRCSAVAAPAPLFSALLNYRHKAAAGASQEALEAWAGIKTLHVEDRTSYPLNFCVDDLGEGFELTAQLLQPVDPHRMCDFMRVALEKIIEALESSPQTFVRSLDVLPAAERERLLARWSAPAEDLKAIRPLHELFEEQAAATPHLLAVHDEWRELSYEQLNHQANQLARRFIKCGVGPGDIVAICLNRSADTIVALFAALKAGAAYAPLDPNYPPQRLQRMLQDASPRVVVTQQGLRENLVGFAGDLILIDEEWSDIARQDTANLKVLHLTGEHPAYLIFTSGSTGRPKAAIVQHRGLTNLAQWYVGALDLSPSDKVLVTTSYSFDLTQKNLLASLLTGASVHLAPEPFDPLILTDLIARELITVLNLTPSAFSTIADADSGASLTSLRFVVLGGEPISAPLIASLWRRYPDVKVVNSYGPTECADVCAFHLLEAADVAPSAVVPIGFAVPNVRLCILDNDGRLAPFGVHGELYVGGVGVGAGYLNRPDLTAERFVPDPFGRAGERIYRTGDLARYRADGAIEFSSRIDCQVKIRGFRDRTRRNRGGSLAFAGRSGSCRSCA